jgi:hypothetical protein
MDAWHFYARVYQKTIIEIEHIMQLIQHCPYSPEPNRYGADAQHPLPSEDTQKLTDSEI